MRPKNLYIYQGDLESIKEDYEFLGADCELKNGCLTVFAVRRKPERKQKMKDGNK